ncbi:MAG: choice-of-anchor L domain-containing protein [Cyanobacteria bacterium J06621_8]
MPTFFLELLIKIAIQKRCQKVILVIWKLRFYALVISAWSSLSQVALADLTITSTTDSTTIINALTGQDVSVSNITINQGSTVNQTGVFSGGDTGGIGPLLGIADGVVLVTGDVDTADGPNTSINTSTGGEAGPTDSSLATVDSGAQNDTVSLQFNVVPAGNTLSLEFVFASEEYNEFVCTTFNDAMGIFVSGPGITGEVNIARIDNNLTSFSINEINGGTAGSASSTTAGCDLSNSAFFVDNVTNSTNPDETPFSPNTASPAEVQNNYTNVEYDGFTIPLASQLQVQPGQTYTIKVVTADIGDGSWDGAVFVDTINSFNLDYGDAPDTYGTTGVNGAIQLPGPARHSTGSSVYLGSTPPDAEANGTAAISPNAADGDDSSGDDDEDAFSSGLTVSSGITSHTITDIPVNNTSGQTAQLMGWIDFNQDGDFLDAGEQAVVNVAPSQTSASLSWSGFSQTNVGNTYARFRITTDSNLINSPSSVGLATDGEVEDYEVAIADPPANTISGTVFEDFGAGTTGNNIPEAGENGLGNITVSLYLDDGDGLFDAASDTLSSTTVSNSADGTYSLGVNSNGTYFVVLDHLDSDAPNLNTALPDRTVRLVTIADADAVDQDFPYDEVGTSFDVCPADAFLFQNDPSDVFSLNLVTGTDVLEASNIGNRHVNGIGFNPVNSFIYGSNNTDLDGTISRVDSNYNVATLGPIVGLPTGTTFFAGDVSPDGRLYFERDDILYIIDTDPSSSNYLQFESFPLSSGVSLTDFAFNPIDGQIYAVANNNRNLFRINPSTGNVQNLGNTGITALSTGSNAFGAQFYDAAGFLYLSRNGDGTIFRVDTRNPASIDATATAFTAGPTSSTNDGARCLNAPVSVDFGDAPESYGTRVSDDGARHDISLGTTVFLGTAPDGEIDGQPSNDANGDGDDEDDISLPDLREGGTSYTIPAANITATAPSGAILHAWIDFDNSGTFEDTEHTSVTVNAGSNNDNLASDLTWTGITVGAAGDTYARFRITTDSSVDATTPVGVANDGEVEDYQVTIDPVPELILVKRITAINPGQSDERLFSEFVDDLTADGDNNANWLGSNGSTNTYTLGEINGGQVTPGDVIEYTIYFLSNGSDTAQNVLVCDLIPADTEFITNDFDTVPGATGGIIGSDRGLAWESNGEFESLTNGNDDDNGYYFAPGVEPTSISALSRVQCGVSNPPNTNGAVVIDLDDLSPATAPGSPADSYGFVRFRVQVK